MDITAVFTEHQKLIKLLRSALKGISVLVKLQILLPMNAPLSHPAQAVRHSQILVSTALNQVLRVLAVLLASLGTIARINPNQNAVLVITVRQVNPIHKTAKQVPTTRYQPVQMTATVFHVQRGLSASRLLSSLSLAVPVTTATPGKPTKPQISAPKDIAAIQDQVRFI